METIVALLTTYVGRIALAIVIWFAGRKLIALVLDLLERRMDKVHVDESLHSFLSPLLRMTLKVLLVLTVAATVGIEITTFAAILGAASLAIGLAFQGSLANFAGGILILLFRPFKVGDFIEATGFSGTVMDIQVFHTILKTPDNQKVIIPNADLSNTSAINYSAYDTRRANLQIGVSFKSDIKRAKEVLRKVADDNPLVLQDPEPVVVVGAHGDHGYVVFVRIWAKNSDYWTMRFKYLEDVVEAFDEAGIEIPYQQLDVHVSSNT
ncbi:MAG TPA: mechanosensitive ion channel domain-containing protein [Limnochordia bacterium]|nr:mechanosensitive ion channel domain-containing protein [Limnochordia bacterium]